jgi:hypothetical protein
MGDTWGQGLYPVSSWQFGVSCLGAGTDGTLVDGSAGRKSQVATNGLMADQVTDTYC